MAEILKPLLPIDIIHSMKINGTLTKATAIKDKFDKLMNTFSEIYRLRKKVENAEIFNNYQVRIVLKNSFGPGMETIKLSHLQKFYVDYYDNKSQKFSHYRESVFPLFEMVTEFNIETLPFFIILDIYEGNICKFIVLNNENIEIRMAKYFENLGDLERELLKYLEKYDFQYEAIYMKNFDPAKISRILENLEGVIKKKICDSKLKLKNFKFKDNAPGFKFQNFRKYKDINYFSFDNFMRYYSLLQKFGLFNLSEYREYLLQHFFNYYQHVGNDCVKKIDTFIAGTIDYEILKIFAIDPFVIKFYLLCDKWENERKYSPEHISLFKKFMGNINEKKMDKFFMDLKIFPELFDKLGKIIYQIEYYLSNSGSIDYEKLEYFYKKSLSEIEKIKMKLYDKLYKLYFDQKIISYPISKKVIRGIEFDATGFYDMEEQDLKYIKIKRNETDETNEIKINKDNTYSVTSFSEKKERLNELIGYKIAKLENNQMCLIKLTIPTDAKIATNGEDMKFRSDKAHVAEIYIVDINSDAREIIIDKYDGNYAFPYFIESEFIYKRGETMTIDDFDGDLTKVCVPGIHFFLNAEEPFEYIEHRDFKVLHKDDQVEINSGKVKII